MRQCLKSYQAFTDLNSMEGYYAKMRGLQDRRSGVDWTFFRRETAIH